MLSRDIAAGVSSLVIGLVFIYLCSALPLFEKEGYPGPAFFPLLLSLVLIVSGVALALSGLKGLKQVKSPEVGFRKLTNLLKRDEVRNALIFIIITAIYIAAIPYIGFMLSSLLYVAIIQVIYGVPMTKALPIAIASVLFIYVLFVAVLRVVLPEPILYFIMR